MVNTLLESTLGVRERLGRASELHLTADVVSSRIAVLARFAGLSDFQSDSVARDEVFDGISNGDDCAARFVSQSQWLLNEDIAIAIVVVVVQIRAAETCGFDGDLDLVTGRSSKISLFLE